jgi:FMN phosphatase YigB (HAD superfamily)
LKEAGYAMVVFSNGAPQMLDAIMGAAGLHTYLQGFVSVDEVGAYKPSPKVYRYVAERLERPIGEVRLVSSNPFDIIGAEAAGMRACLGEPVRRTVRRFGPAPGGGRRGADRTGGRPGGAARITAICGRARRPLSSNLVNRGAA